MTHKNKIIHFLQFEHRFEAENATSTWIWTLVIAILFPEVLTLLKSGFIVLTQHVQMPPVKHLVVPIIFQTIHCFGICILFFVAMPGMSVVKMSMITSSACLIPSLFKACADRQQSGNIKSILYKGIDLLCLMIQIASIGLWSLYSSDHENVWSISIGLVCTSFGWWEAYLPYDNAKILQTFFDFLLDVRDQSLHKQKQHVVNCIVSCWKIILTLALVISISSELKPVETLSDLFTELQWSFENQEVTAVKPGAPPAIQINETFSSCNSAADSNRYIPYLTYPDEQDCSGFWVRVCLDKEPTLRYVLCPGESQFFSSHNSFSCYNEGTCCQANDLVDCGNRKEYVNCPNLKELLDTTYPSDPNLFNGWDIKFTDITRKYYPFLILLVQISSTYAAYLLSYFAFETRIEVSGFAVPMTLAPLTVIYLLTFICNNVIGDVCYYDEVLPISIFFSCNEKTSFDAFLKDNWIFILTFFSQVWISVHIWTKRSLKLAKAELIFDTPFYDALLIEQSLLLNRRMDDEKIDHDEMLLYVAKKNVKVLGCATMWHETESEMSDLIDSILRIDAHEGRTDKRNEDSFDFEMHVLFDNAFENGSPNSYVDQLISILKERKIDIKEKNLTPYGGRLTWELKFKTILICHLKDKTKIKIKKRWSQLLYFLYFLGKDTVEKLLDVKGLSLFGNETSRLHHQNTFILALDGDVTFEAVSIVKLVDHMKKDDKMGAVCGRIHPRGNGFISMYQKFEYAVGHWLQKTTEDVLGNVLCSPGCFSLYRLNALVESHVNHLGPALMEFAKVTKTPLDCIQHDQGEDRWLCTLLIERGWRIEYSAVSDAYTACPESFDEFYNQRRRWTPSTVANLIELVSLWKSLFRYGNLSIFHIFYQLLMLAGAMIGPGSIFILLVGGFQLTFEITYWTSFILNLIPVIIFILVSVTALPSSQMLCAKVLSLVYGLSMIAIVFALLLSVWDSCPWAPSTVSLELTAGAFILVGLLHPLEIHYLVYGMVYYLTIPSMYMLLPLFCVFNLDDVSWGTREVSVKVTDRSVAENLRYIFNPAEEITELKNEISEQLFSLKASIESLKNDGAGKAESGSDELDAGTDAWVNKLEGELKDLTKEEESFMKSILNKYLLPEVNHPEFKKKLKDNLITLKNEVSLLFLFLNASWAVGIFLLQLSAVDSSAFTIDWLFCELPVVQLALNTTITDAEVEYMPLDPINFVFILFFLLVLLFQGTILKVMVIFNF